MKGKFVFHFKSGMKIVDRNNYQTMAQAKNFAKNHNKGAGNIEDKIIKVTARTPPKLKRRKKSSSALGTGLRMPKFRF